MHWLQDCCKTAADPWLSLLETPRTLRIRGVRLLSLVISVDAVCRWVAVTEYNPAAALAAAGRAAVASLLTSLPMTTMCDKPSCHTCSWVAAMGYDPQRRSLQQDARPSPSHGHYPRRRSLQVEDWRLAPNPFARTSDSIGAEACAHPVHPDVCQASQCCEENEEGRLWESHARQRTMHDSWASTSGLATR